MARKSEGRKAEKSSASRGRGASRANRGTPRANRGGGSDGEDKAARQERTMTRMAERGKKSGCVPKLFMLLLPFAAIGTYLLLRS